MIPDEAVEAALKDVFTTSELSRHVWGPKIRAILEAAAPHMMAAAWDEGMDWANALQSGTDKSDNPYRDDK